MHLVIRNKIRITLKDYLEKIEINDYQIIRDLNDPIYKEGGIAILRGNLAPEGSVIKQSGVAPNMRKHKGPAKVFESDSGTRLSIQQ